MSTIHNFHLLQLQNDHCFRRNGRSGRGALAHDPAVAGDLQVKIVPQEEGEKEPFCDACKIGDGFVYRRVGEGGDGKGA